MQRPISAPIAIAHADRVAQVVFSGYRSAIVRIRTDDGLDGFGECMCRLAPNALSEIVAELKPLLVGQNPLDTQYIWDQLYAVMMNRGHTKGFFIEALSGIDIALWDLKGKALGKPVWQLLGGMQNPRVWAYASSLRFRTMEVTLGTARSYLEQGFRAMKIKIGPTARSPVAEAELVGAIRREVGPDVTLMVDANCGYDLPMAIRVAKALEPFDLLWFEEPLPPDDLESYRALGRSTHISIAAGESEFTRFGQKALLDTGVVRILQPSACRTGGITECERIAALSSAYRVPYAPHTGSSSAIAMVVALHLSASLSNFLIYEYMMSDWNKQQPNPLRWDLLNEPLPTPQDGYLDLCSTLTRPGLGYSLNDEVVRRWQVGRR